MTLLSVVIPTFNRAAMLRRALVSVFEQTYADIEIVVVDDGSTDDTSDVVSALAAARQRTVRYRWQENRGCAAARNRGIKLSSRPFIAFLDSDDEWRPDAVESMLDVLAASGADFVYSPCIEVLEDGSEYVNYPVAAGSPQTFAQAHFASCNVRNGAVVFRRQAIEAARGYDETLRFNEDSDLLQRIAIRHRAAYSPTPTLRTFHHEGNKSRNAVGLHRALVVSAENILRRYPEFASTLDQAGLTRLNELRGLYIEALLAAGRTEAASDVAASMGEHLTPTLRLAVRTGSSTPISWGRRWRSLSRRRRLWPSRAVPSS